jgi:hypothetical protein
MEYIYELSYTMAKVRTVINLMNPIGDTNHLHQEKWDYRENNPFYGITGPTVKAESLAR